MSLSPFSPPRRTLLGPGPSNVSRRVLDAMARPTIGHLDPAFIGLMDDVKALLQYAFQTSNALTMPISGPGTAGMEACVVNLVEHGTKVVVCENGVFGGRLRQMVERAGGEAVVVSDEWGRAVSPEKVEAAFEQAPDARLLAFVHAETSTGARSDAAALCEIASRAGAMTVVDTVTSLGGIPVDVDRWRADAVYSGTQKCLSCVPGLSPVSFSDRAVEHVRNRRQPVQSWFLDIGLVVAYWGEGRSRAYHHTAPVNSLYALHEALLALREEGLEAAWARHAAMHSALRAGLETMGLQFVVPEDERLPQLNVIRVPDGVDESRVRARLLEEHKLEIGAGLGTLAGKVWRIGLMGYSARRENVRKCIGDLANVLTAEGFRVDRRSALDVVDARLVEATAA
jgi:alanine-glyoxylate transaminase / serine-glyoxylate transaminase / serine-pyruvate transaminase